MRNTDFVSFDISAISQAYASANVFVVVNSITNEPGATVTYNAANSTSSGNLGQLDAIIDGGSY